MTLALFPRKPYIVIFLETSRGRGNCQLLAQIWTGTKKVEKVGPGQHLAQKFQKHVGGPKKFSPHKKGHCKQCWLSQLLARKSRKHVGTKNLFLPDWGCWLCKELVVSRPSFDLLTLDCNSVLSRQALAKIDVFVDLLTVLNCSFVISHSKMCAMDSGLSMRQIRKDFSSP